MFYIVYKTSNQVNGKFYIGTHKTTDLNDDYLGSGTLLKRAIKKYGIENFKKEILFVFDNPEDMFAKESQIVTEEFLSENNTYNLKKGGEGGFDFINADTEALINRNRKIAAARNYNDAEYRKKLSSAAKGKMLGNKYSLGNRSWTGRTHTAESKEKISSKAKTRTGEKNSQFGSIWITNVQLGLNKKIRKSDPIPDGWVSGRTISGLKH